MRWRLFATTASRRNSCLALCEPTLWLVGHNYHELANAATARAATAMPRREAVTIDKIPNNQPNNTRNRSCVIVGYLGPPCWVCRRRECQGNC